MTLLSRLQDLATLPLRADAQTIRSSDTPFDTTFNLLFVFSKHAASGVAAFGAYSATNNVFAAAAAYSAAVIALSAAEAGMEREDVHAERDLVPIQHRAP